jgi:membrane protein
VADRGDIPERPRADDQSAGPDGPTELSRPSWKAVVVRTVKEFQNDNLTDWAAALTYYAVLALFPAMIVLVALLGLLGQLPDTFDALIKIVEAVGPRSVEAFAEPIRSVIADKETAGALLGFGLLGALWSASGYVGAFMRVSNAIYEVEEGRPFWKLRPLQIAVTIAMMVLLALVAIALVVTGPLAEAVGGVLGLSGVAVLAWSIAKWPVMVIVVVGMIAVLYWVAPNVQPPRFRWFTPGGTVAVLAWILASVLFGLYVANFGSYDKTYGSLGGAIAFLVWLWISNLALLFGAELNAELERARELEAGLPAEQSIQLPFRDPPD